MSQAFESVEGYQKFKDSRVMVVDDEEFCIEAMKAMLFKAGVDIEFQVDFCISGQEAVD
jgi:CheY-like chemotaxis protein